MAWLRALVYFVEEALLSLWRSRLVHALSVATIAVSLFVLGAFLTLAGNLDGVVERWTRQIQVVFYVEDAAPEEVLRSLEARLKAEPGVAEVDRVTRAQALERFRALFRELATLPEDLRENPFPGSLEVTLQPGAAAREDALRLVERYREAPGVEDVLFDLLWIERLSTAVRLVRGVGALLGGVLVLAGVFTISNVIRLTVYARQDELDIMRLVGATRAYIRGPFLVEGMLQGLLGGLVSLALLGLAFRFVTRESEAIAGLLGRPLAFLSAEAALVLVLGGAMLGLVGSLVSLGRSRL
ncbi:MAG: ABC transporter permease [Vicinamibacteria bacterium]|nr:ABC transporter permease [Vicinamibacteria bacterium]